MNKIKLPYYSVAIILGIALVIFGGYDDAPGAQLLGLIVVIASIVGIIKRTRRASEPK